MSLFKKRGRRNIRKKAVELEDGSGEEDGATMAAQPAASGGGGGETAANGSPQPQTQRPSSERDPGKKRETRALLSFKDELADEGPEFKVKKTNLSRRAAKMTERERRGKKEKRRGGNLSSMEEMMDGDGGMGEGGSGGESEEEGEGASHLVSLSQQLKGGGFIPNAEFIHRARREREERRLMGDGGGGAPSVMSLSTNKKISVAKGKSRLVREDDNDRSDDSGGEEGGRRRMDAGQQDTAAVKQFQVLQGLEEMGSDEDEETKRWEEEQILKGVKASAPTDQGAPQMTSVPSAIDQSFLVGPLTGCYVGGGSSEYMTPSYAPAVQAYAGLTVPRPTPTVVDTATTSSSSSSAVNSTARNPFQIPEKLVPITIESLKSRLSNQLRDLQDSASGHRERLEQIVTDLERSGDEVRNAEERRGDLGRHYEFYQEMRGYLRDLLSCLGEKEPEIVGMERTVGKVRKERADLLIERRRQDIADQDKECAASESAQLVTAVPQEVLTRQRRAVEREGRRRRRRERREKTAAASSSEEHRQGLSTDDELLEMNRLKFENGMNKALSGAEDIFSDVVEDFCHLSHIKQRLEEWKFRFPDSYSQAHIPLHLPRLFTPFIRLQMLQWNPLESDCSDFESMSWFEILMFYGFREGVELDPDDPDTHLLPELVDHIIIPKLTTLVQSVWDPLSSRQTKRLTSLLHQLAGDYPSVTGSRGNTQSLFTSVLVRLRRATQEDIFIPLYTRSQVENPVSPRAVFYGQQFWSCAKLLGNITEWEGLVAPDALQELVLDGLLNRYLVLSLQTCPSSSLSVIKTEAIISRLPSSWLSDGTTVTRPLQHFISYLVQLSEELVRASAGHPDHVRHKTRNTVRDIARQLVRLGAETESSSLSLKHNLSPSQ